MQNEKIQQLFDSYQDLSIEVEQAKILVEESGIPDLSKLEYVSAEQADEHLIAGIELERKVNHLNTISNEWTEVQDLLVEKLCKINTKVRLTDKRDQSVVYISCSGGAILIEEKS